MIKINHFFWPLFVVFICLSLFVRTVGLDRSPISINFDEASLGYNAYSISQTGKDEYGISYPINLRSFNDYKPALYAYLTIPWIKIWGLNQTTVRLTSAVLGTMSLVFLFLITRKLFKITNWLALLGTFVVSFYPWRIHYSRVALETNISTSFFIAAVYFLIGWRQNLANKILFFVFAFLSIYSYHSARLAIPVLVALYFFDPINYKSFFSIFTRFSLKKIFTLIWPLFVLALIILPIFVSNNSAEVFQRFNQTNVFSTYYPFTPKELSQGKNPFAGFLYHPFYYFGGIISGHLLSYFSPRNLAVNVFLWIEQSTQGIGDQLGNLGWIGGILFIFGLISFSRLINFKSDLRLLLYWLLAGIIPSALTLNWLYPFRSLNAFPAFELISLLGLFSIIIYISRLKKYISIGIFIALGTYYLTSITFFLQNEWNYGIWQTNGTFQPGGFKEASPILNSLKNKYKTIYLDSPHAQSYAMFNFYMNYPPSQIQRYASIRPKIGSKDFLNFNFDNFVYKKYDWLKDRNKNNIAIFTSSEVYESEINSTPGAKLIKIYNSLGIWVASIITKD